ncbi:porin family protein [uncultured Draconibacterium sp.]|uniref:porin family protein n=1 Tax=uncultured Draconibacterium sp. TaxID=1573823 RepID=UPI002AA8D5AB|nr:porin family protein [uncultured Draconibacterium sp.]
MTQKKFSLLIMLLFVLPITNNAQDFKFGGLTGITASKIYFNNKPSDFYEETDALTAFNINAFAKYKSASFWGVAIEPGFIQKGYRTNITWGFIQGSAKVRLNYIQLPILAELYLSDKLYFSLGPELAYLLNAKYNMEGKTDITDIYDNRFELSGLIGVNYNIYKNFDIGLRYNRGLTKTTGIIFMNETGEYMDEAKEYNQYLQIIVNFTI